VQGAQDLGGRLRPVGEAVELAAIDLGAVELWS